DGVANGEGPYFFPNFGTVGIAYGEVHHGGSFYCLTDFFFFRQIGPVQFIGRVDLCWTSADQSYLIRILGKGFGQFNTDGSSSAENSLHGYMFIVFLQLPSAEWQCSTCPEDPPRHVLWLYLLDIDD